MRVAWEGEFEGVQSLALVNRAICRGLVERGHDVKMIPSGGPPPPKNGARPTHLIVAFRSAKGAIFGKRELTTAVPTPAEKATERRKPFAERKAAMGQMCMCGIAGRPTRNRRRMASGYSCSRGNSAACRRLGCPCSAVSMRSGPTAGMCGTAISRPKYRRERVHVIPLGVDPELFQPGLEPLALPTGPQIRFLFVGGTIFRKGIDLLLTAFGRAFRATDGIGLVIKEMGSNSFYRGQTAETEIGELRDRGYPVEYIDRDLTDCEMAGLYAACDCLVHPFRGEGFGLPVVEAMACGLPVIVTGAGPALDYSSDETAYLIPASRGQFAECRVGEIETIGRPWLFEPDADVLVELLKCVAGDLAAARAKGTAASAHIRENFTWARTVDAVERRSLALLEKAHPPSHEEPETRCGHESRQPLTAKPNDHSRGDAETRKDAGALSQMRVVRDDHDFCRKASATPGNQEGLLKLGSGFGRAPEARTRDTQSAQESADSGLPSASPRLRVRPCKVSLTMIVRDEQRNLPHCLDSIPGLFDEIVIVDTGSKDRTREIAQDFGRGCLILCGSMISPRRGMRH